MPSSLFFEMKEGTEGKRCETTQPRFPRGSLRLARYSVRKFLNRGAAFARDDPKFQSSPPLLVIDRDKSVQPRFRRRRRRRVLKIRVDERANERINIHRCTEGALPVWSRLLNLSRFNAHSCTSRSAPPPLSTQRQRQLSRRSAICRAQVASTFSPLRSLSISACQGIES